MKSLAIPSKILSILAALATVGLFFAPFVTFTATGGTYGGQVHSAAEGTAWNISIPGIDMVFGLNQTIAGQSIELAVSSFFTFTFIMVAFAAFLSLLSYKFKGSGIASLVFQAIALISIVVYLLSSPSSFVDRRAFTGVDNITYTMWAWLLAGGLLLAIIVGAISVLVADAVQARENKTKTILQRMGRFLKEFKSEVKKIVWPSRQTVTKNVIVVLVMCAIIGGFIILLDFGLAQLLNLIYSR